MNLETVHPPPPRRPAWIEVDLDAIAANISAVKAFVGPRTDVMAVVKANAYGHGLLPAARAALRGDATALGVALLEEGLELRSAGIQAPVIGAVCMDQILADVTGLPGVSTGDEVTLLGRSGGDEIAVPELARKMEGIPHEVVSQLSTRLPRLWEPNETP